MGRSSQRMSGGQDYSIDLSQRWKNTNITTRQRILVQYNGEEIPHAPNGATQHIPFELRSFKNFPKVSNFWKVQL